MAMSDKLLKLQQKLQGEEDKKKNRGGSNEPSANFPFWDAPNDTETVIRLLPDADQSNDFFWKPKLVINMPFDGVVGGENPTNETVRVTVPCVEMWGKTCPVQTRIRPWWKDPSKEDTARTYYKKKSNIFQGFVVRSSVVEENPPANPIRRFAINQTIFEIIYKSLINPEFEDMPTDYIGGRDFKIAKTQKGGFANYGTSSWTFRTRPLTEVEQIAIDTHGLFNLSDHLGFAEPDEDGIQLIKEMFEDSLAQKPFDFDKYGSVYRPYVKDRDGANSKSTNDDVGESRSSGEDVPASVSTKPNQADIMSRIRSRTAK